MGVEKTVIRDAKSDGGIIGITRKPAAMLRWTLTRHRMGEYAAVIHERSRTQTQDPVQSEKHPSNLLRDEKHCQDLVKHLSTNMTNPFDVETHPPNLINISTGIHATKEVEQTLLGVVGKGQKMMENFVNQYIVSRRFQIIFILQSPEISLAH